MRFLSEGKLGDFIHSLVTCKYIYDTLGEKTDLFISNQRYPFSQSLENIYKEISPVLEKQNWLNSLKIYNGEEIDINLANIRNSPYLFKTSWIEVFLNTFVKNPTIPKEYSWIELDKDIDFKDCLLINRTAKAMNPTTQSKYDNIIDKFDKKYFICYDINQYNSFTSKNKVELLKIDTIYDYFVKINSCKLFLGNMSGPAAIATSVNIPRVIELWNDVNRMHYLNDVNYYSNFSCFQSDLSYS